jgi:malto-oligosyltrehalose trehalohydrolase
MKRAHAMPFGASPGPEGVRFRLWAPGAGRVGLELGDTTYAPSLPMLAAGEGWFELVTHQAGPGTRYRYRIDGELAVPDPASRFNPGDVHGASAVVEPRTFDWSDGDWTGRPWHEAVIYELHVGTFSPAGTFRGVRERLDYLVALGVTAIELMPLADFPGARNWGYDGVLAFAPDASYGTPDELKALVAAAHARGLMILIDVVYNHFGPEGNYLPRVAPPFFTDRHPTPWGAGLNFDGPDSRVVRDFFLHNALYWLEEFHADGLRLDAVHAIVDDSRPDFLTELARAVHEGPGRDRHVHLILENDRNEARRLARDAKRHPLQFTAQWNDDFHHVVHRLATDEASGCYADYARDPLHFLGRCLAEGFAYQGDASGYRNGARRGEPSAALPPEAFVNFLQNHDQVGNRAFGDRLNALAPAGVLRGALAILLLAPSPPLLFMGEEFGAATPFLFFCDFGSELAATVRAGRRAAFAGFPPFDDEAAAQSIPDPGAPATAARSVLDWDSIAQDPHASWLAFYCALLALRMTRVVPLIPHIVAGAARHRMFGERALEVRWPLVDARALVLHADLPAAVQPAPRRPPPGAECLWESYRTAPQDWAVRWTLEPATHGP